MNPVEPHRSDTTRSLLAGLEQAIDAVVMIDAQNNVTHFNAAAERIWGYRRDEVLGNNISMSMPFRRHHDEYISNNRTSGVNCIVGRSREVRVERKDGSELWGLLSMSRVEVDGDITYMGFLRDVTAEVRQREEITRLSLVVDKTNRAIFIAGHDARIDTSATPSRSCSAIPARKRAACPPISCSTVPISIPPRLSTCVISWSAPVSAFNPTMRVIR